MIEVNLSPVQTQKDFTKLGPINLSLINPIYLVIAIIAIYMVEGFVSSFFDDDIAKMEAQFRIDQKTLQTLRVELSKYAEIKQQVRDLDNKEQELAKQIDVIKQIVDKRQNPFLVLKYVAEKTPEDIWIIELELDDRALRIKGFSKTWVSISNFIEELRQATYFDGTVNYVKPPDLPLKYKGNRVEAFEINTMVNNFYGE